MSMARRYVESAKVDEVVRRLRSSGYVDRGELLRLIMELPTITKTRFDNLKHKPRSVIYGVSDMRLSINRWKLSVKADKKKCLSFLRSELIARGIDVGGIKVGEKAFIVDDVWNDWLPRVSINNVFKSPPP